MGRKSKLTEATQQELYNTIAAGNTHETACALAGIATSTFYDWLSKGEKAKSGKMRDFYELMKKGEALAEAKRIEIIRKAGEGKGVFEEKPDWKAAAWYLERRYPEKWGRRHLSADLNHSGEVTEVKEERHRIEVEHTLQQDPESRDLLKQLWRREQQLQNGSSS
jgi:transposase